MDLLYTLSGRGEVMYLDAEHIAEYWDHERHLVMPDQLSREELSKAYHSQFVATMGDWLMRHGGINKKRTATGLLCYAYEPVAPIEHEGRTIFAGSEWSKSVFMIGAAPCLLGLAVTIEPLLTPGRAFTVFDERDLRFAANHLFDAMQWRGFALRQRVSDVGTVLRMKAYRNQVA